MLCERGISYTRVALQRSGKEQLKNPSQLRFFASVPRLAPWLVRGGSAHNRITVHWSLVACLIAVALLREHSYAWLILALSSTLSVCVACSTRSSCRGAFSAVRELLVPAFLQRNPGKLSSRAWRSHLSPAKEYNQLQCRKMLRMLQLPRVQFEGFLAARQGPPSRHS